MKKKGFVPHSRQPRHIPQRDTNCSKCGLVIEVGDGRRFRMKYRHFHCLPETRLNQIEGGFEESSRTRKKYAEAFHIKHQDEGEEFKEECSICQMKEKKEKEE